MNDERMSGADRWARLRFSVIGSLLASPPSQGELAEELAALAKKRYQHPTQAGRWVTFGASTIERWYYKALHANNPIVALRRKVRSDAGRTTAMRPALLAALEQQYKTYRSWSYQLHSDNLAALVEEQPELGPAPSYSTVRRRMQERGWKKRKTFRNPTPGQQAALERLEKREVRSYEASHNHALWHWDCHEGKRRVVDVHGAYFTPHVFAVLDDRCRVCCHAQWYRHESAENVYHGLCQAFHKRGLPRAGMSDNGGAMTAGEIINGLESLSVVHETTLAYSAYQNGKQEDFWGTLEGRLMAMLKRVEPLTLEFLNRATQAWVELEYNRRHHSEIGMAPLTRLLDGPDVSRPAPDSDTMRFGFSVKDGRTQRKSDGTISIRGARFEIPSRLRTMTRVAVRYQSWDLSQASVVDPRTGDLIARIFPQDKVKNADGRRRPLEPVGQPHEHDDTQPAQDQDPLPPLMRRILADYAATGLPPAYLPKEETR